jgi:hypothetical protein
VKVPLGRPVLNISKKEYLVSESDELGENNEIDELF